MSVNYDVIVIFPINVKFGATWKPKAWSAKLTFSLIVTFYLTKTENKTEKSLTQFSDADIGKLSRVLVL